MSRSRLSGEHGIALIVTLMAMTLVSTVGAGLILMASTDSMIASNFRAAAEARYAAASIVELARNHLAAVSNWDLVLAGAVRSAFTDGPPSGTRAMTDRASVDLSRVISLARCGRTASCTDAQMNAATIRRPWGANNPRWQPYAFGPFESLTGQERSSAAALYVLALVGDDGLETDGDPLRDGSGASNPGLDILLIRGEAFSAAGAHAAVEATVGREPASGRVRVFSWRSL